MQTNSAAAKEEEEEETKKKTMCLAVIGTRLAIDDEWVDSEMRIYLLKHKMISKERKVTLAADVNLYIVTDAIKSNIPYNFRSNKGINQLVEAWTSSNKIELIQYRKQGIDFDSSTKERKEAGLLRDVVILNDCTHMLAFPHPKRRSGRVWKMVRAARERGRDVCIVRYRGRVWAKPPPSKLRQRRQMIVLD